MLYGKVDNNTEGSALGVSLGSEIGTDRGHCVGMSVGKDVKKIEGSGERLEIATGNMDWYLMRPVM